MGRKFIIMCSMVTLLMPMRSAEGGGDHSGECLSIEYVIPNNSVIRGVVSDGFTAMIHYLTPQGNDGLLILEENEGKNMLPIILLVNGVAKPLKSIEDKIVVELFAVRKDCYFSHSIIGKKHLSRQWLVEAVVVED